jgi:hypothetical protein
MNELLWTCEGGTVFTAEAAGVRAVVLRAPMGGGYRYQLLRPTGPAAPQASLASGYRQDLREAMEAAERAAKGFARPHLAAVG